MLRPSQFALAASAILLVLLAGVYGCQSSARHFTLRGHVLAKDAEYQQLTVSHQAIPGFMPAMAMSYPVKDAHGLSAVQPGDEITADIYAAGGNYWLEHLAITDSSGRAAAAAAASAVPATLKSGAGVPDVALINQDGKTIHLRQFQGKAVLVTFIYTRCPLPNFCPLISSEFASLQNELAGNPADFAKTHLVSISLDPAYDTAPVLRKYGLAYLQNNPEGFKHWDFTSTSPSDLKKLADAFGLQYYEQNDQIVHSMETLLIAPDGSVARAWDGTDWHTSDVLAAIRQEIGTASQAAQAN